MLRLSAEYYEVTRDSTMCADPDWKKALWRIIEVLSLPLLGNDRSTKLTYLFIIKGNKISTKVYGRNVSKRRIFLLVLALGLGSK